VVVFDGVVQGCFAVGVFSGGEWGTAMAWEIREEVQGFGFGGDCGGVVGLGEVVEGGSAVRVGGMDVGTAGEEEGRGFRDLTWGGREMALG
jgi:hypothetical protein